MIRVIRGWKMSVDPRPLPARPEGLRYNARLAALIGVGGGATLAALVALAVTQASLGSPLFFALVAVPCATYAILVAGLLRSTPANDPSIDRDRYSRLLIAALALAVAFRVPLTVRQVSARNDMVRYLWDGRLQTLGYNPFLVKPDDPSVAHIHTDDTRQMPSIHDRTPYPAAAQLFFRAVVAVHDSSRAMKLALVLCDLLTIAALLAWLRDTHRSPWLALIYAWNPLVILEIAHSGHVDALGALWITVSAWMLSTGRGMRAAIAFALAVGAKLLPIVLLPLYWKRLRIRDAAAGTAALALLYVPFASAGTLPLGALPNVVQHIRFNGPIFKGVAAVASPSGAALFAVLAGIAVAAWMRRRTPADDPAGWGWPMAVSLACAPVIYPWYLLYFTPFLFSRCMRPLVIWTFSVLAVYVVWELSRRGHRWFVPTAIVCVEYGVVLTAVVWMSSIGQWTWTRDER